MRADGVIAPQSRGHESQPSAAEVMARAGGENFPVASFVLPRAARAHLLAIYGFARLVDELGDSVDGDRLAALDELEADLDAAFAGRARSPLLRALTPTLNACSLPREPFVRLIEANRADQRVHRYESFEQLRGYCELSANPVGELVLRVFGLASEARIARSDEICTALQLIEHCQDVREDHAAGRVYLPAEELRACGCSEDELGAASASPALRAVIAIQMRRARGLLAAGLPLIGTLSGRPKLAVAGYAAGGLATIEAIEAASGDVLSDAPVRASGRGLALALARVLSRRLGARR